MNKVACGFDVKLTCLYYTNRVPLSRRLRGAQLRSGRYPVIKKPWHAITFSS